MFGIFLQVVVYNKISHVILELVFTIQIQLKKIFGFRIIGGYMDKNSWIAESEALDELIAQKGCRTFQLRTFQP